MGTARLSDPLLSYQFQVEVTGGYEAIGYFTEISGVGSEHEVTEHKVVDHTTGKELVQQIPGRVKWGEVTFKKGLTTNTNFWEWRQHVVDGNVVESRSECTITMYDRAYAPVVTWIFENAWPSKISGPEMKSDSSDFTVEELTIVHEGLYRFDAPGGVDGIPARSNDRP